MYSNIAADDQEMIEDFQKMTCEVLEEDLRSRPSSSSALSVSFEEDKDLLIDVPGHGEVTKKFVKGKGVSNYVQFIIGFILD